MKVSHVLAIILNFHMPGIHIDAHFGKSRDIAGRKFVYIDLSTPKKILLTYIQLKF